MNEPTLSLDKIINSYSNRGGTKEKHLKDKVNLFIKTI